MIKTTFRWGNSENSDCLLLSSSQSLPALFYVTDSDPIKKIILKKLSTYRKVDPQEGYAVYAKNYSGNPPVKFGNSVLGKVINCPCFIEGNTNPYVFKMNSIFANQEKINSIGKNKYYVDCIKLWDLFKKIDSYCLFRSVIYGKKEPIQQWNDPIKKCCHRHEDFDFTAYTCVKPTGYSDECEYRFLFLAENFKTLSSNNFSAEHHIAEDNCEEIHISGQLLEECFQICK